MKFAQGNNPKRRGSPPSNLIYIKIAEPIAWMSKSVNVTIERETSEKRPDMQTIAHERIVSDSNWVSTSESNPMRSEKKPEKVSTNGVDV